MMPSDLLSILQNSDTELINHANEIVLQVAKMPQQSSQKKQGTDNAIIQLSEFLRKEYDWENLTLDDLTAIQQQINSLSETWSLGIGVNGINAALWLTALNAEVENQIVITKIPQYILISEAYLDMLSKENSAPASATAQTLKQKKIDIVTTAVRCLKNDRLQPKERINFLFDNLNPDFDASGINTALWLTALNKEVENQIAVDSMISQCLSMSEKYLKILSNDKKSVHTSTTYQTLTQKKIDIVTVAVTYLKNTQLPPKDRITEFERTLKEGASTLKQHRYSKNWLHEGAKQASSLFLVNLYRLLMGTKSNNLLSITDTKNRFERIKEGLHRFKEKVAPSHKTPKNSSLEP